MEFKLYVGHLAAAVNESALQQLFSQAGAVGSVSLPKDHSTGQSKGFAFVTMATAAGAQKAISKFHNYELAGQRMAVSMAEQPKPAHSKTAPRKGPEAGYQSKLGAFSVTDRSPKATPPPTRKSGGYQSKLGAFGGNSAPTPPRRRGGSQRH